MHRMTFPSHRSATGLVIVAAATLLTACGSSNDKTTSTATSTSTPTTSTAKPATSSADAKIAALVPAKFKSKGTLTVASDASYAPMESVGKDGKTVEGVDPDLASALGQAMGLKVNVVNAGFDSILPGLKSGKYDMGMSAFTDTKEREQTVDFVTYFSAGTSFYVKAQGGLQIQGLADLCGKKVAVEKGTTQADDAGKQSKKCKAGGKPAVTSSVFPDFNGVNLALSSGRVQVAMGDLPVAAYQVKQSSGQFKLVGQPYGTAPFGIATPKGSGLDKAILPALKKLMADGKYAAVLKKWGVESSAITDPKINGATS
jgi:polar amino acid transport system substrate-binding protein